jgi:hypothetical protein
MDRTKYERMRRAKETYYEAQGSQYLNNESTLQREDDKGLPSHNHDERYFTKEQQNATQQIIDTKQLEQDNRLTAVEGEVDTFQSELLGKADTQHSHADATTASSGFMSAADKTKLNNALTSAPVTSVNGKTGAVSLTASDVSAASTSHTHANATESANGFMSNADKQKLNALPTAPVESVNGRTGSAISLIPSDIGAAPTSHSHSEVTTAAAGFMGTSDKSKLDGVGVTFIQAVSNAVQSIPANTTTKINFGTLQVDKKGGEFAGSTFTPSSDGYYLISSLVEFTGLTAASRFFLYIYRNGAENKLLGTAGVDSGISVAVSGTALIWLAAGNTVDIRMYSSAACSTRARGANYDYVHVVRLF